MFDELADQGRNQPDGMRRAVARAVRQPWSRYPFGVGALLLGASSLVASWAVEAAGPEECMELQQAEFTLEELIATKDKVLAYERDPVGELVLSGKEASFVLADNLKFPVWIETREDELFVQFALPDDDHCYNIEFLGTVQVDEGQAHLVPSAVRVGDLDLSALVAGRPIDATPDDLVGAEARQLLSQTRRLRVQDDEVRVVVDDPRSLR